MRNVNPYNLSILLSYFASLSWLIICLRDMATSLRIEGDAAAARFLGCSAALCVGLTLLSYSRCLVRIVRKPDSSLPVTLPSPFAAWKLEGHDDAVCVTVCGILGSIFSPIVVVIGYMAPDTWTPYTYMAHFPTLGLLVFIFWKIYCAALNGAIGRVLTYQVTASTIALLTSSFWWGVFCIASIFVYAGSDKDLGSVIYVCWLLGVSLLNAAARYTNPPVPQRLSSFCRYSAGIAGCSAATIILSDGFPTFPPVWDPWHYTFSCLVATSIGIPLLVLLWKSINGTVQRMVVGDLSTEGHPGLQVVDGGVKAKCADPV